jgi:hypothetical protein
LRLGRLEVRLRCALVPLPHVDGCPAPLTWPQASRAGWAQPPADANAAVPADLQACAARRERQKYEARSEAARCQSTTRRREPFTKRCDPCEATIVHAWPRPCTCRYAALRNADACASHDRSQGARAHATRHGAQHTPRSALRAARCAPMTLRRIESIISPAVGCGAVTGPPRASHEVCSVPDPSSGSDSLLL